MRILTLLLLVTLFIGCEKVIDVDLDDAEIQTVIEADLREGQHNFEVSITNTAPYFESGAPQGIPNASVVLSDSEGNSTTLTHQANGLYSSPVNAVAKRTYTLTVQVDGKSYTASSYLPPLVPLVELSAEFTSQNSVTDEGYLVYITISDPVDVANYYRIIYSLNGEAQFAGEDLNVFDDRLSNGSTVRFPLFGEVFELGDTVQIELISFDKPSFEYFDRLSNIIGGGGGLAAPGNPTSNWQGDFVLGHFTAQSSDSLSIIIME